MSKWAAFSILVTASLFIQLFMLPLNMSYRNYVCGDAGSALQASWMLSQGITPWLEFNYNYGLGTLWLNQAWFTMFGYTPIANVALNLLCSSLLCWALAELIAIMAWNRLTAWFIILASPWIFSYFWYTTAHCLEAALIILCLVRYLRQHYATALLLATLTLLIKPSLAWFAGCYLVIVMLMDRQNQTPVEHAKRFLRYIAPSFCLLLLYAALVLVKWSPLVLLYSLLPLSGMAGYQESACGFFNRGLLFWLPTTDDPAHLLTHYVFTPAGLWLTGTILMLLNATLTLMNSFKTRNLSNTQRCLLFCTFLHLAFILVLFGNEWSWTYCVYLVILGTASCQAVMQYISRGSLAILALFLALSLSQQVQLSWKAIKETVHYPDMKSLWMPPSLHEELAALRSHSGIQRILFLGRQGAPSLVLPVHSNPTWAYMQHSATPYERSEMLRLIDQADVIVIPLIPTVVAMTTWPEIELHLKRFKSRRQSEHLLYLTP